MAVLASSANEGLSVSVMDILIEVLAGNWWRRSSIVAVSCWLKLAERESSTITVAILLSVVRIH